MLPWPFFDEAIGSIRLSVNRELCFPFDFAVPFKPIGGETRNFRASPMGLNTSAEAFFQTAAEYPKLDNERGDRQLDSHMFHQFPFVADGVYIILFDPPQSLQ